MSQKPITFQAGNVVYRNTWKNSSGNIRTNLYFSRERAEQSARNNWSARYQEIATPVTQEDCLMNAAEGNYEAV